ncbi:uncharacterized protein ACB058_009868 isoform 2-T4 [Synchiropus picturatus]
MHSLSTQPVRPARAAAEGKCWELCSVSLDAHMRTRVQQTNSPKFGHVVSKGTKSLSHAGGWSLTWGGLRQRIEMMFIQLLLFVTDTLDLGQPPQSSQVYLAWRRLRGVYELKGMEVANTTCQEPSRQ